jgi:trehalose synthase
VYRYDSGKDQGLNFRACNPRGKMLKRVPTESKELDSYRSIVGDQVVDELNQLAEPLRGAHVLHINATAYGGGVAEILMGLVPLMRDVGLDVEWQVIEGSEEFFNVTKSCHDGLQGMEIPFTDKMKEIWIKYNEINARSLEGDYDFIIVHDPQDVGLPKYHGHSGGKQWIWRCHIDTSNPNPHFWDFFEPYFAFFDGAVFTMQKYVAPGAHFNHLVIIPPTIDPLSTKNAPIELEDAQEVVANFGIDISRPLITQVSRFDPWKDPLGVIDAYRLIKSEVEGLQLALVGSMASDDPEGWDFLDKTERHAGEDHNIFILHNYQGVGPYEVGCFQTASDVMIQKSTREGFGLAVTEALWKRKPVVGGNVGGIPLQVLDGKTGFLVDTVEDCAARTLQLLQNPRLCAEMGEKGREYVKSNFLITRHLKDYLQLFIHLSKAT